MGFTATGDQGNFLRIEGDEYIISLDPPPLPPTLASNHCWNLKILKTIVVIWSLEI